MHNHSVKNMPIIFLAALLLSGTVLAENLKQELDRLKEEVQALKDIRKNYNERLQMLEAEIRMAALAKEAHLEKRAQQQVSPIAFSARLDHDLGYLQDDQILVFDHVITNLGNNYDSTTGIFHCDEAGLYVFQLSVVAVPGAYVTTQIAKNHRGEAWAFSMDPTNSSSGGTMVALYLHPGDAVYARINGADHDGHNRQRSITKQYTSFSGFLVR